MSEPGAVATGFLTDHRRKMWNDTDTPLAYLITFRAYGTWLHGDMRGSVDRNNNTYGTPRVDHTPARKGYVRSIAKRKPVRLDARRRRSIERAVKETCEQRGWHLIAINVRTNHVHIVVATGTIKPTSLLSAIKANATRVMREDGCWLSPETPWVDKGSRRYLWNDESVARAVDYVLNGQGDDLPDFL
ncbi:MAG: transposase [Acidobacteria bacterium]|nr:transposase [Acidobacteriota bacterium]